MRSLKHNWEDNSAARLPLLVSFRGNEDRESRWTCLKVMRKKIKKSWDDLQDFSRKALEMGRSDPRKVVFAIKMGVALSIVSLLIFWKGSFEDIAQYSIWAILTVIVMLEFSIGTRIIIHSTLSRLIFYFLFQTSFAEFPESSLISVERIH